MKLQTGKFSKDRRNRAMRVNKRANKCTRETIHVGSVETTRRLHLFREDADISRQRALRSILLNDGGKREAARSFPALKRVEKPRVSLDAAALEKEISWQAGETRNERRAFPSLSGRSSR